jgi:hypothetical protein
MVPGGGLILGDDLFGSGEINLAEPANLGNMHDTAKSGISVL